MTCECPALHDDQLDGGEESLEIYQTVREPAKQGWNMVGNPHATKASGLGLRLVSSCHQASGHAGSQDKHLLMLISGLSHSRKRHKYR